MRKGIVFLGASAVLLIIVALSFMLYSGDMNLQVQQKVLQQKRVLPVLKTSVTSVTPQKAVLTQGGDPVVVEANGANLGVINSAQVFRAGNAVTEIEATLDKSLLPGTLKVSLKASATAPIASDYQLAIFDSGNNKLLDVPTTVLAIEVVAPVQKAVVAQKPVTAIKTAEPVQRQVQAAPMTSIVKPGVTSVTPQKAVLTRGGEAVIVEAKGTNLTGVGSVQVIRAGVEAQGIEETLDKSQLPNTLKVSLKASAEAPIANDYQLSVFDAGKQKLLDVPTSVLVIEVEAAAAAKPFAPTRRAPQRVTRQREETMLRQTRPAISSKIDLVIAETSSDQTGKHVWATAYVKNSFTAMGAQPANFYEGQVIASLVVFGTTYEIKAPAVGNTNITYVNPYYIRQDLGEPPAGTADVTWTADPQNIIKESIETNNTISTKLQVAAVSLGPDLCFLNPHVIRRPTVADEGPNPRNARLDFTIWNAGDVVSPANLPVVFLDGVEVFFSEERKSVGLRPISPNQGVPWALHVDNLTDGSHEFKVYADFNSVIAEQREDNNMASVRFTVPIPIQ